MRYETIKEVATLRPKQKATVGKWRKSPSSLDAACHAAKYYADKFKEEMAVIPGNSYMMAVYHIATIGSDFGKFRVGCLDGVIYLVTPNNLTVSRVKVI